jgi:hypothetical protein
MKSVQGHRSLCMLTIKFANNSVYIFCLVQMKPKTRREKPKMKQVKWNEMTSEMYEVI